MNSANSLPCHPDQVDDFLSRPSPKVLEALARTAGPVLVLGAGGKMGLHLSLMLQKSFAALGRPDQVIAVSRFKSLHARAAFESHGITTYNCDLMDAASMAALPPAPTIFYLAGVKFGTRSAPELLRTANVLMPTRVADRFRDSRIVAFSSGCVYPFLSPQSGGATERTPVDPVGDYAASCVGRERAFAEASRQYGTPVVLIRLNYAVEFRYGALVDIAQKVLHGEEIDVTMGYLNAIWQTDALAHSILALELATSPVVPVNVTGSRILSVREIAARFGELFSRDVRFAGKEADTAWLNNPAYAHMRFGAPPTRLEDMINWIALWLKNGGSTWGKPTGFERRDGRF